LWSQSHLSVYRAGGGGDTPKRALAGSAEEGSFCGEILWILNRGFKNPANFVFDGAGVFGGEAFQSCDYVFA
jgi:hypothetical protein